jgi:hypothetical protein
MLFYLQSVQFAVGTIDEISFPSISESSRSCEGVRSKSGALSQTARLNAHVACTKRTNDALLGSSVCFSRFATYSPIDAARHPTHANRGTATVLRSALRHKQTLGIDRIEVGTEP